MEFLNLAKAGASVAPLVPPDALLVPLRESLSLMSLSIQMAGLVALAFLFHILGSAVKRPYFVRPEKPGLTVHAALAAGA